MSTPMRVWLKQTSQGVNTEPQLTVMVLSLINKVRRTVGQDEATCSADCTLYGVGVQRRLSHTSPSAGGKVR